jgi:hypothetical protein
VIDSSDAHASPPSPFHSSVDDSRISFLAAEDVALALGFGVPTSAAAAAPPPAALPEAGPGQFSPRGELPWEQHELSSQHPCESANSSDTLCTSISDAGPTVPLGRQQLQCSSNADSDHPPGDYDIFSEISDFLKTEDEEIVEQPRLAGPNHPMLATAQLSATQLLQDMVMGVRWHTYYTNGQQDQYDQYGHTYISDQTQNCLPKATPSLQPPDPMHKLAESLAPCNATDLNNYYRSLRKQRQTQVP